MSDLPHLLRAVLLTAGILLLVQGLGQAAGNSAGVKHPVLNHGVNPADAATSEQAVQRVMAMSEEEMLSYVPERHFTRFCHCPECFGGVDADLIFDWSIDRPDEFKCRFCGFLWTPDGKYPETTELLATNSLGETRAYMYYYDEEHSAGAFSSPPGAFNISVPYTPAPQSAEQFVLPFLRSELPDARLVDIHPLPRVGATGVALIRAAGLGANPRIDVCHADYVGTYRGRQVRMRATIWTWMLDQSAVMGGRGNWLMNCSGAWGPVNDFDRNYAIGRAVLSSMRVDRRWRVNQANTVNDVLNNRNAAMDRWFTDWDAFIRDHEPTTDPKTGERKEVPIGDGDVWIDPLTGKAHRVNPDDEQNARDKNWDRVPK